ncbi:hypothetical protein N9M78_02720, partial [Alphaproteobacteria bacterium]|nr:hypothetical protein [Alphaproteobacteria bacterium]
GMMGGYTPPGGAMPGMDPAGFGALMAGMPGMDPGMMGMNPGMAGVPGMPGMPGADPGMMGGYMPPGGAMPGYADPAAGGFGGPMAGGYGDPMAGGYGDPYAPGGFGGPMAGGFGDPYAPGGFGGPMAGGFGDPFAPGGFGDPFAPGGFGDPFAPGGFGDPMAGGFGDPMAGGYIDPMAGGYIDPMAGGYIDPMAGGGPVAPNGPNATATEIIGTSSPDNITARFAGDIITGAEMGDMLYSGSFSNVVFNYNSFDLASLRNEASGDTINNGWMDFNNPSMAYSNINVGLGSTDKLSFENITLKYGNTTLNASNGNQVISLNSSDNKFTGDGSGGGVLGDVCLFDAGKFGGMSGNIVFGIDLNGDGTAINDIFFDVDDSISTATYDAASDAFTFSV